jgi:hypothetical protein
MAPFAVDVSWTHNAKHDRRFRNQLYGNAFYRSKPAIGPMVNKMFGHYI